jgi:hypothetical protein
MPKDEAYYFRQTPEPLCRELVKLIPDLKRSASVFIPFAGEGEWIRSLPDTTNIVFTETEYGTDYKTIDLEETVVDWVVCHPPVEESLYSLVDYFAGKAHDGLAFLVNAHDLSTLTPSRLKNLYEEKGVYIHKIVVCHVKKWGLSYFVIVKNRCCIACKRKKQGCCPKLSEEEKARIQAEHDEHERKEMEERLKAGERFDFFDFVEGSF